MKAKIKLLLPLATIATVAPIAVSVSCGGETSKFDDSTITPDLIAAGEKAQLHIQPEAMQIQNAHPYSTQELMKEALLINDNSGWNRGIAYHTLTQTISLLRAFAEEEGYTSEKDFYNKTSSSFGVSISDDQVSKPFGDIVDESTNSWKALNAARQEKVKKDVEVLKTLTPSTKVFDKADMQRFGTLLGDNNLDDFNQLDTNGIAYDKNVIKDVWHEKGWGWWITSAYPEHLDKNDLTKEDFYSNHISSYQDHLHPGTIINDIETPNGVHRKITVNNLSQVYPVIEKSHFESDYIPYIKATLYKFIDLYVKGGSIVNLGLGAINAELKPLVTYLIDKNSTLVPKLDANGRQMKTSRGVAIMEKHFSLESPKVNEIINKLNNGSHHMLAIKTLYTGYDETFQALDYRDFSVTDKQAISKGWPLARDGSAQALIGLKDMKNILDITGFVRATDKYFGSKDEYGGIKDMNMRIPFIASQTPEQIYKPFTDEYGLKMPSQRTK